MIKGLVKMFYKNNTVSSYNGEKLARLFLEEVQDNVMVNLKSIKKEELKIRKDSAVSIELATAYLFCFRLVTQTNAFSISQETINNIYYYFFLNLVRHNIQEYSLDIEESELMKQIQEKVDELLLVQVKTAGSNFKSIIKVMHKVYQNIYGTKISAEAQNSCILYMLLESVTIIQDYLIELS